MTQSFKRSTEYVRFKHSIYILGRVLLYIKFHVIHQARIQPHFNYCSTVLGNCGKLLSNKLQKRARGVYLFIHWLTLSMSQINEITGQVVITCCGVEQRVPLVQRIYIKNAILFLDLPHCNAPLGMENGKISDTRITASSFSPGNEPARARLRHGGSWCPAKANQVNM